MTHDVQTHPLTDAEKEMMRRVMQRELTTAYQSIRDLERRGPEMEDQLEDARVRFSGARKLMVMIDTQPQGRGLPRPYGGAGSADLQKGKV